jgi:hypothetical protein
MRRSTTQLERLALTRTSVTQMTNDGSTTQTRSTNTEPITAVELAIEHISEVVSSIAVRFKGAERKRCCGRYDCRRVNGAGVVIARKPRDADPNFLEQTRRRKPIRGARFETGAVAAAPSSRDSHLTSLRQLARIGKDDLRLPLVINDLSVTQIRLPRSVTLGVPNFWR